MENNSILIVEDEKKTVELLKLQLQSEGFTITAAYDGEEGLQKAKKEKPSLIILDIMLPKIDGLEVCRILKNDSKTKNIPVVILTCRHDMEVRLEGFKKGADDYIVKPFDHRELLARINSILRLIKLQNTLKASIEEVERISVINEINKAISSSLNLEEVLKIIGCQTKRLIDYDLISVALLNKGNKFVKVRTLVPHANIEVGEEFYIPFESSFLTQNITGGTTLSFSDKKILELSVTPDLDKVLSAIIVPLNVRRKTIGSLNIGSYKENAFSTTELEVANQIASQVAIAMENARLYERVSESEKNYHQLFDNALDLILLHDPETGSVIGGNRKVIEALGFSEDELIKMSMSD